MTRLLHAYRRAVAWLGRHHQPIAHDFEGEGGLAMANIKPFLEAEVGDDAFTWENAGGSWGEYTFETIDPLTTHDDYTLQDISPIVRKRWRLVDVVEITVAAEDDDPHPSLFEDAAPGQEPAAVNPLLAGRVTTGASYEYPTIDLPAREG